MIKKLRLRFIRTAMLSVFSVLAVIIGSINILNYRNIITKADDTLTLLSENNGRFPDDKIPPPKAPDKLPAYDAHRLSPELPYESRYFSVLLYNSGETLSADTGKIAAIDTEAAIDLAGQVLKNNRQNGFIGSYRYMKNIASDTTRIIFLDCTRDLSTFYTFLFVSCASSAVGLLAVLILIIIFSKRLTKPVTESYEKQKQFITNAGHEIKTPLAIIRADTDVLEMDIGENEWLLDIRRQTSRLSSLTADLIMLSKMEEDKNRLMMTDFPLSEIVSEAAEAFKAPAKAGNKTIDCRIEPLLSLHGDEGAIRKLLFILIDNAVKYTPNGGAIYVSLSGQPKTISIIIENTPVSLSIDDIQKLSERFYRADKSRSSDTGGFGLGLSIAKAITEAHKGQLDLSIRNASVFTAKINLPT